MAVTREPLLSPLELPGWIEFNVRRTGLRARPYEGGGDGNGTLRSVLYLDRRGRVRLPPNNPYLPMTFEPARSRPGAQTSDWLRAAAPLADEIARRGSANQLLLPPAVADIRPWLWRRFVIGIRYTYLIQLPFDDAAMDPEQRRKGRKAATRGMTVERVGEVGPVMECLADTEERKGFSHGLPEDELRLACELLGEDALRMYVCFDPDGRPASTTVFLHAPGSPALSWIAGTRTRYLADNPADLAHRFAFDDLAAAGADGIDLCGANIPSVATFKSHWGGALVAHYTIRTHSVRAIAAHVADWVRPPLA